MGCCDKPNTTCNTPAHDVREKVRQGYTQIAHTGSLTTLTAPRQKAPGGCCGSHGSPLTPDNLAQHIGYSLQDIQALPDGANMGLSCGNPTALANLTPGQTVLDLGSGGGFDVFLAGPKLTATGRAIGVDMTPDMLSKARRNIPAYTQSTGLSNVEFRLGEIEHLPVADATIDVVISNCVINLSPEKPQVWREIARVLKPGGKVAASDMALLQPLPASIRDMFEALVGCVAGAVLLEDYRQMVTAAGLTDVVLRCKPEYIAALAEFKDPLYRKLVEHLPPGTTAADFITSVDVQARKP